jgi:hypothetical protein
MLGARCPKEQRSSLYFLTLRLGPQAASYRHLHRPMLMRELDFSRICSPLLPHLQRGP